MNSFLHARSDETFEGFAAHDAGQCTAELELLTIHRMYSSLLDQKQLC